MGSHFRGMCGLLRMLGFECGGGGERFSVRSKTKMTISSSLHARQFCRTLSCWSYVK